jgi:hypothetical protein
MSDIRNNLIMVRVIDFKEETKKAVRNPNIEEPLIAVQNIQSLP